MEIIIRGDKVKVTDSMKDYLESKIKKLEKYLKNSDDVRVSVRVRVRNVDKIVEITIPLNSIILRSEERDKDFYKTVDKAVSKLERGIRKNKTKISRHTKAPVDISLDDIKELASDEGEIKKRKTVSKKPMSEEEAILQMELLSHEFYMFINSYDNKPTVIYKRKNGGYGLISTD